MPRLELDEHVHVGLGAEVVTQHGAEQRQPADVMAMAELGDLLAGNRDATRHPVRIADHRVAKNRSYYPDSVSPYIELRSSAGAETREGAADILVDLDATGAVVDFDIDHASKHLDLSTLETVESRVPLDEDRLIPSHVEADQRRAN